MKSFKEFMEENELSIDDYMNASKREAWQKEQFRKKMEQKAAAAKAAAAAPKTPLPPASKMGTGYFAAMDKEDKIGKFTKNTND